MVLCICDDPRSDKVVYQSYQSGHPRLSDGNKGSILLYNHELRIGTLNVQLYTCSGIKRRTCGFLIYAASKNVLSKKVCRRGEIFFSDAWRNLFWSGRHLTHVSMFILLSLWPYVWAPVTTKTVTWTLEGGPRVRFPWTFSKVETF